MFKSCILLSTYNGEHFLQELLDSIIEQEADIIIRDDGSTDKTLKLINSFASMYSDRVIVLENTGNIGVTQSFITLLRYAISQDYSFYFFCDQDDVWLKSKCMRATQMLSNVSEPALYFSRKEIVDEALTSLPVEDKINFTGTIWDCFESSNVSGCTMCMNRRFAELAIKNDYFGKRYLHDAFIYRLAIAVDAFIVNDDQINILYRQHGNNVVGSTRRKRIIDKINKNSSNKRTHYMQLLMRDLLNVYYDYIPEDNLKIIKMVNFYISDSKEKRNLICEILFSKASVALKGKLVLKILGNIL